MKFVGEVGSFEELPKGSDMTEALYNEVLGIKKSFEVIDE